MAIPFATRIIEAPSQQSQTCGRRQSPDAGTRMVRPGCGVTEIGRGPHELKVSVRRDPLKVFPVLGGDTWGKVGLSLKLGSLFRGSARCRVHLGGMRRRCLRGNTGSRAYRRGRTSHSPRRLPGSARLPSAHPPESRVHRSQASPSSTRPHAIGKNSTRPDVSRGWLPTPLPSGQAIGREDQL